jgi:uncharacterized YccA/Bax inhibitor family protein
MDLVLVAAHAAHTHAVSGNAAQKRHLTEIGLGIAAVGGIALVLAGAFGLRSMSRAVERTTIIAAGILLTVGFIVQFFGVHGTK